jgi:hypothetical protein
MPLPLPPGVTAKSVQDGEWTLHVQVTPRFPAPAPPPAAASAFLVARCDVDANRVVHCELWRLTTGSSTLTAVPGSCNFLVVAAVTTPPATGAGP